MVRTEELLVGKGTIRRDIYKKGKTIGKNFSKTESEINKLVDTYLFYGTQDALDRLLDDLSKLKIPPNQVKNLIKTAISANVKEYNKDFDRLSAESKESLSPNSTLFDGKQFLEMKWLHSPYFLKNSEYLRLLRGENVQVFIDQYDYSTPIFYFGNNFKYTAARKATKDFNDLKFYLNCNEKFILAKKLSLNFDRVSERLPEKIAYENKKGYALYNQALYDNSLTVAMYSLLDGKPDKAHCFMRYDGGGVFVTPHHNLFFQNDPRKEVYPLVTNGPHFHFQNEDDSILCLKKFRNSSKRTTWLTSRCNAIDIEHLVKYLHTLDHASWQQLQNLMDKEKHYCMPFLVYKYNNKALNIDVDLGKSPNKYTLSLEQEIKDCANLALANLKYSSKNACFKKLIKALLCLSEINERKQKSNDCRQIKILTDLEIAYADGVVDSICNTKKELITQDCQLKYNILGSYLRQSNVHGLNFEDRQDVKDEDDLEGEG